LTLLKNLASFLLSVSFLIEKWIYKNRKKEFIVSGLSGSKACKSNALETDGRNGTLCAP